MASLVYALNVTLDGYVDHDAVEPDPVVFRHFIEDVKSVAGAVYGRRMYEVMRYWDDGQEGWGDAEREYAEAWRAMPKWVVSRTLDAVGPNATLLGPDLEAEIRALKEKHDGIIEVAGPELAHGLAGLIDEYRMYMHPVVAGKGKRYFAGPMAPLKLAGSEMIGESVIRLRYVPKDR